MGCGLCWRGLSSAGRPQPLADGLRAALWRAGAFSSSHAHSESRRLIPFSNEAIVIILAQHQRLA